MSDCVHIVVTVDDKYSKYALVFMHSICARTQRTVLFHYIDGGLSSDARNRIANAGVRIKNASVRFVSIDDERLRGFPVNGRLLVSVYYRLLLGTALPDLDKVLYLDVDISARGDIGELYDVDLGDKIVAAVEDGGPSPFIARLKRNMEIPVVAKYFNAGMLLISLNKWRQAHIEERVFNVVKEYKDRIFCNDQDVLNKVFSGDVLWLPRRFNSLTADEGGVLRHFYLGCKPWDLAEALCEGFFADYKQFWNDAREIGAYDEIAKMVKYRTPLQQRMLQVAVKRDQRSETE